MRRAHTILRTLARMAAGILPLLAGAAGPDVAPEFRGLWVDTFHPALRTATEVRQLVADASAGGFNALLVEVRKRGDAYYNSRFEPKASDVSPAGFDPLAELVRLAHDTTGGQPRIEVHAWIVTYNIWNRETVLPPQADHPYRRHPDWLTESSTGARWDGANYAFDPAHPAVQDHTVNVALDLVERYPVDGLHLDYIRYAGRAWGYHPVAVERFNRRTGRTGRPSPDDPAWLQFRRDQVTSLVRRIYLASIRARPDVKVSAATIAWAPGITSSGQWTTSAAFSTVLQDWRGWMQEGILDLNIPMAYFRQSERAADWAAWGRFAKDHRYRRHVALGAGTYLNPVAGSLSQLRSTRTPTSLAPAADGLAVYSYAVPASDGTSGTAFRRILTQGLAGDPLPPLFADPVPVPAMPWKAAPETGHLLGQVRDPGTGEVADGAVVTLRGPVTRTLRTDANGWFGAVDLPPGDYLVSVAPLAGHPARTARVGIDAGPVRTPQLRASAEDDDGDGMANAAEDLAGTDPVDPDSVFQIGIGPADDGTPELHYGPVVVGRRYTVEWRPVDGDAWRVLRGPVEADPGVHPLSGLTPAAALFRVRVEY